MRTQTVSHKGRFPGPFLEPEPGTPEGPGRAGGGGPGLPDAPRPGDFARYRTRFKLRKLDQHLVFAVQAEVGDGAGRAEVDFKP
jgi:hypothetical protein